jgi:glycosyltransferase involved in cell wall biosynthesis
MKIAFYAPMKSPLSPHPSGDRTIGRLLIKALERGGCAVQIASELRSWVARPDAAQLANLRNAARAEAGALVDEFLEGDLDQRPDIWLTYHSYYKAPDFLGPLVSAQLGVPYMIIEGSYSARRQSGEWVDWLGAARDSIEQADSIVSFTDRDRRGLAEIVPACRLHHLAPFLDLEGMDRSARPAPSKATHADDRVRMVSVAMMRPGAKLESYRLLATALKLLPDLKWRLDIVGDGTARADVQQCFAAFPADRIAWHGRCNDAEVLSIMRAGDVIVWPGIDEAFGMTYLEAQACGLPVAACRVAGVPEVVRDGQSGLLAKEATSQSFASVLERLLVDVSLRETLGLGARVLVEERHSISAASERLCGLVAVLVGRR